MLFTPHLYSYRGTAGATLDLPSDDAPEDDRLRATLSLYADVFYFAALNAWEVRRYDSPEMGECSYRLMDFVEWASNDGDAFVKAVNFVLSALTGKELKDYAAEGAKPSETAEKTANESGDEDVKKKSKSRWITRLFRRSS